MRNLLTHIHYTLTQLVRNIMKYTVLTAIAAFCGIAIAQTGLTTIQDTLFKADGTRFSGSIAIHWNTFDPNSGGTIVQQSRTVRIVNGNLQVSLAPNAGAAAPANTYTVMYQSDGREQFSEAWTVPVTSAALRVADVRTGVITTGSSPANTAPIVESSVVGLVADLAQRPVKGAGFGTGSVAVINQNGQIETVVGNVGDCVFADGTTGPCGGQSAVFYDAETPAGLVDGSNNTFTLLNPPGASLTLFRNGMYMKAGFDYTLTGGAVQFVSGAIPQPLDTLVANYRVDPASNLGNLLGGGASGTRTAQVLCSAGGQQNTHVTAASLGSCDIAAARLLPGDRVEIRFTFAHTGTASGFDVQLKWGSTTVLARHGGTQDAALAGQAEAAVTSNGAQITLQSWGSLLAFLPGILNAPAQNGVKVDFLAAVSREGSDSITLTNYTVLRYPGH